MSIHEENYPDDQVSLVKVIENINIGDFRNDKLKNPNSFEEDAQNLLSDLRRLRSFFIKLLPGLPSDEYDYWHRRVLLSAHFSFFDMIDVTLPVKTQTLGNILAEFLEMNGIDMVDEYTLYRIDGGASADLISVYLYDINSKYIKGAYNYQKDEVQLLEQMHQGNVLFLSCLSKGILYGLAQYMPRIAELRKQGMEVDRVINNQIGFACPINNLHEHRAVITPHILDHIHRQLKNGENVKVVICDETVYRGLSLRAVIVALQGLFGDDLVMQIELATPSSNWVYDGNAIMHVWVDSEDFSEIEIVVPKLK